MKRNRVQVISDNYFCEEIPSGTHSTDNFVRCADEQTLLWLIATPYVRRKNIRAKLPSRSGWRRYTYVITTRLPEDARAETSQTG